jgi:hypothetical protein
MAAVEGAFAEIPAAPDPERGKELFGLFGSALRAFPVIGVARLCDLLELCLAFAALELK